MYTLLIKPQSNDVRLLYEQHMPNHSYNGDAGLDLYIPEEYLCKSKSVTKINHLVSLNLLENGDDLSFGENIDIPKTSVSFMILPRSSISLTPLILTNSVGLIDSGYRGNILAYVYNVSSSDWIISKGSRLFQVVAPNLKHIENVKIVDELNKTTRGSSGFGSSGILGNTRI